MGVGSFLILLMKGNKMKSTDINEFINLARNRKVICFGAGLQGIRFINIMDSCGMADNILCFADNNSDKWGNFVCWSEYKYEIVSVEQALSFVNIDTLCVITCLDVEGMKSRLDSLCCKEEIWLTSMLDIAEAQLEVSQFHNVIKDSQIPIIPKKIHYCWFGNEMPDNLKQNIEQWHRVCPDYEIVEWNENNLDLNKNRYAAEAYEMKKWGFVPDYFRLDIIYRHGGIYLDTDIELIQKPDDLLYQKCFASFDATFMMNLGGGFGSIAGTEIVKNLRDYYDYVDFKLDGGTYNNIPCTTHSYNVLKKYGFVCNDKLQRVQEMNIYPMIFQGINLYTGKKNISEHTYFMHHGTLSWLSDQHRRFLKANYK